MKRLAAIFFNFFLVAIPGLVWAAEGHDTPTEMGKKVSVEGLGTITRFFAESYNDNLWLYATVVTVLMGVMGMLIALVTDIILKMVGLEVSKIEHHE